MARNLTTGLQRGLRRSIAGGLGASDLFSVASLDLRFAQTKTLDPRITFTRASSGTYVGSDGLIKTATTNLLLRSEEFNDASWTKQQSSVSSNATTAPNGTLTADKLIEDSSNNIHTVYVFSGGLRAASALTFSVYAKSSERTSFALDIRAVGSGFRAVFNLSAQTATGTAVGSGTLIGANIQNVGDGWFRCSVIGSHPTDTSLNTTIRLNNPAGTDTYTGDGTSGLFIWGAQLEQSSTVGEYIPTTSTINSAPRFDHNPTTGESLGLLVEEQRTNLLLRSEDLTSTWLTFGTTVTANATTAPDGTTTADKLINTTANVEHGIYQTTTTSGSNTFTVFAKQAELRYLVLRRDNWTTPLIAVYDLQAGTVSQTDAGVTAAITAFPNGWYRCSMTCSTPTGNTVIKLSDVGTGVTYNSTYTGTAGQGIFVWGVQLEAGSFPTSYIPTTTATVTRSADVASITGVNFSSWYNQTEGTVFADYNVYASSGSYSAAEVSDGTSSNRMILFHTAGGSARFLTFASGSAVVTTLDRTAAAASKWTGAYKAGDYGSTYNANAALTNTYNSIITGSQIRIGSSVTGSNFAGTIRRLTYWPSRLPNATLQQITR